MANVYKYRRRPRVKGSNSTYIEVDRNGIPFALMSRQDDEPGVQYTWAVGFAGGFADKIGKWGFLELAHAQHYVEDCGNGYS